MESIAVPAQGYSLKGKLFGTLDKPHPRPALLFFHGWSPGGPPWKPSDLQAWICARNNQFISLSATFRGMGSSGNANTLTRADFLEDATAFYDFLAHQEGVDPDRISLVGESFGAYMACLLSTQRPVRNLILRVPTDFPDAGFADVPHIRFAGNLSRDWKLQRHQYDESLALKAVHHFHQPIFIIASEHDQIVPRQTTENYLAAISDQEKCRYFLMKNAGHGLINPRKQYDFIRILMGIIQQPGF